MAFILLMILSLSLVNSADSTCKKLGTELSCCKDQFKNKDGKCVECQPGTFGYNCAERCPPDYYGHLCTQKCNCEANLTCNHITGCESQEQEYNSDTSVDDSKIWKIIAMIVFPFVLCTPAIVLFIFFKRCSNPVIIRYESERRIVSSNRLERRLPMPNLGDNGGGNIANESEYEEIRESTLQSCDNDHLDHSHRTSTTRYCSSKRCRSKRCCTLALEKGNGHYSKMSNYSTVSTKRSFTSNNASEQLRCNYDHIQDEYFTQRQKGGDTFTMTKTKSNIQAGGTLYNDAKSFAIIEPTLLENVTVFDGGFNNCEVTDGEYNGDNNSGHDNLHEQSDLCGRELCCGTATKNHIPNLEDWQTANKDFSSKR